MATMQRGRRASVCEGLSPDNHRSRRPSVAKVGMIDEGKRGSLVQILELVLLAVLVFVERLLGRAKFLDLEVGQVVAQFGVELLDPRGKLRLYVDLRRLDRIDDVAVLAQDIQELLLGHPVDGEATLGATVQCAQRGLDLVDLGLVADGVVKRLKDKSLPLCCIVHFDFVDQRGNFIEG